MKYLQNIHTHTIYSDGRNTPEELIEKALSLGFTSLGFSDHSPMYFHETYEKWSEGNVVYKKEVKELKEKYRGVIDIFMGIELELCAMVDLTEYEYVIGGLHYLKIGDEIVAFDRGVEEVKAVIDTYFGGDGLKFAKYFYNYFADIVGKTKEKIDVIAHYDLCAKHPIFINEDSKEYRSYALEALHAIGEKVDVFELNTGGIARGYRKTPYLASFILKELKNMGKGIIIGSDCHNKDYLDYYFDEAVSLLIENGFKEAMIFTKDGFKGIPLD